MPRVARAQRRQRRPARILSRPTITIVCEGRKTEPNYFQALGSSLRLKTLRVSAATQPGLLGVQRAVRTAVERAHTTDEIWCVVDDDERGAQISECRSVFGKLRNQRQSPKIHLVLSTPCFEYWLLLHFKDTTKSYRGLHRRSACAQVIEELKSDLRDYRKNDSRLFKELEERMPVAIERAKRSREEGASSTEVWRLVERLLALAATADSN